MKLRTLCFVHFLFSILSFYLCHHHHPHDDRGGGQRCQVGTIRPTLPDLAVLAPRHLRSQLSLATVATVALRAKSNVTEIFATYHLKCLQNKLNIFDLGLSRQLRSELIFLYV